MSHLGPDAQRLLARTKRADDPTFDDRARMRARLDASWAGGEVAASSRVVSLVKRKWIVGACSGLLLVSSGAYWLQRHDEARVPARAVASARALPEQRVAVETPAPALAPPAPAAVVAEAAAPLRETRPRARSSRARPALVQASSERLAPLPPSAAAAQAHRAETDATSAELAAPSAAVRAARPDRKPEPPSFPAIDEELSLVGAAQDALQAGHPSRALQLVQEHAFRFPRGALARERLSVQTLALCALGRKGSARQVYVDLAQRAPGSAVLARVRSDCGFE